MVETRGFVAAVEAADAMVKAAASSSWASSASIPRSARWSCAATSEPCAPPATPAPSAPRASASCSPRTSSPGPRAAQPRRRPCRCRAPRKRRWRNEQGRRPHQQLLAALLGLHRPHAAAVRRLRRLGDPGRRARSPAWPSCSSRWRRPTRSTASPTSRSRAPTSAGDAVHRARVRPARGALVRAVGRAGRGGAPCSSTPS